MQGLVVLPDDVQIVRLSDLSPAIRSQMDGEDGDFALTRPLSRTPSKVIGSNAAALLEKFRDPNTIVAAILAYSKEFKQRPADVLEEAYPLIESCLMARLLVEPGTDSEKIVPSFAAGDLIGDNTVVRLVQALIDSEVYQVTTSTGRLAALKIARLNAIASMRKILDQEAELLRRIDGAPAPDVLGINQLDDGRRYLLVEWFDGDDANSAAQKINEFGGSEGAPRIAELCANVVEAYATLHERGFLHADVHPRNVLVSESGEVRIIDFGIARAIESEGRPSPRAGVAFFFEPEYAQAIRSGARHLEPSLAGEQYSVAALLYSLLCGKYYMDFSFDKDELLRQIVEDKPWTFERRGAAQHQALEEVVLRALHKKPDARFATTRQFAEAFRAAVAKRQAPMAVRGAANEDSTTLLERVLTIIKNPRHPLSYVGPASPSSSLTYGAAGIAYAAYRIACAREDAGLLALSDAWAERAAQDSSDAAFYRSEIQITPETVGRVSPFHTASGVAAVQALLANVQGDTPHLNAALNQYLHLTAEDCDNPDLTLGQASVLHGLTLLLASCGPERPQALVDRGNQLCARLRQLLEQEPAIGEGGTIPYLGIAHGWAGLLYAMLRWDQLLEQMPPVMVEYRLSQLAGYAQFTRRGARWPVQVGPGSITLSGWCNGSAGYTHLWALAHQVYGDNLYLDLAEKSAMDAFEGAGGGHGLCCGFAGQAYAQLSLFKHTGNRQWLDQARTLAIKASVLGNAALSRRDEGLPHSLYKGDVGVAVLIAEIDKPELAAMPFFELEP